MGVAAAVVGGALLGLGASKLMNKNKGLSSYDSGSSNNLYNTAAESVPTMPESPVTSDGGASDAMLAAEEEQRKKLAAQAEQNKTNFTGGLGLTDSASVQRKTLLGE